MSGLIDPTTAILKQALDGLTSRQSAISSNLANIDTPGYQPQVVDFESALQQEVASMGFGSTGAPAAPSSGPSADVAMATSNPRHYATVDSSFTGQPGGANSTTSETLRNDSNQVDLETEMTALTQTQIKYSAVSRLVTAKFSQLYTVLGGH
jgi:flagellar basal-body rod protein FlgB